MSDKPFTILHAGCVFECGCCMGQCKDDILDPLRIRRYYKISVLTASNNSGIHYMYKLMRFPSMAAALSVIIRIRRIYMRIGYFGDYSHGDGFIIPEEGDTVRYDTEVLPIPTSERHLEYEVRSTEEPLATIRLTIEPEDVIVVDGDILRSLE